MESVSVSREVAPGPGAADLERMQAEQLQARLGAAAETAYGRAYGFGGLRDVAAYRSRVPLVEYEDVRPWVDRVVAGEAAVLTPERAIAFFRTSGTTAAPKLIPVTQSLVREKARGFSSFWNRIYTAHPAVRQGRMMANFGDGGSSTRLPTGVEVLSETTFWNRRMQALQRWSGSPLPDIARSIEDADLRYYTAARLALASPLHALMGLNPSTLLRFCRVIEQHREELVRGVRDGVLGYPGPVEPRLAEALAPVLQPDADRAERLGRALLGEQIDLKVAWPDLDLVVCWQSEIVGPYLKQLPRYLPGVAQRDYLTQSSECIMAVPIEDGRSGGLLATECHFYEFIAAADIESEQPATCLPRELEEGASYELVVTTGGGLYRYRTGDCFVVRQYRGHVPFIEFQYRKGRTSSVTGEKLTEQQVLEGARRADEGGRHSPLEYLCFPRSGQDPHYGVLLHWPEHGSRADQEAAAAAWVGRLDAGISAANGEYADKRASGRLGPMVPLVAPAAAFERYRRLLASNRASEEQIKMGVLTRTLDLDGVLQVGAVDAN